jgi:type IV pilus assembly protein PilB
VLSTLHTNDAAGAITRFVDMGIEPFLVASVMIVSFAQRLVRTICPSCKASYRPSTEALEFLELNNIKTANFQQGRGCFSCMHTGYKGRTGVYEVLVIDDFVQDLILKRTSAHEIARLVKETGRFTTLKENAAEKVVQGITSLEEAASAVMV